ncbi:MAG: hypothetical protein HC827_11000 [Cyanobacteria bacterium RM1_2_2]|nr:hypothetical protein [Cyanobacteria bacterium RM1_2_2]
MPTSSSPFRTLLAQFQSRYPMGCLSSDLLTIHQGQYVVRSIAQVGNTILATGMASASDIEAAEDRSKIRALEALGLGIVGVGGSPIPTFANPLVTAPFSSSEPPVLDDTPPTPFKTSKDLTPSEPETSGITPTPSLSSTSLPKAGAEPLMPKASPLAVAPTEPSLPASAMLTGQGLADRLVSAVEETEAEPMMVSSKIATATSSLKSPVSSLSNSTDEADRFAFTTDLPASDVPTPDSTFAPFESAHSVDSSFDSGFDSGFDSTLPSGITAVSSPTNSPTNSPPPKSEKSGKTSKRKSDSFELPPAPTPSRQPSDRSEEIMKIGIEMKRLGWSTEQGREYLKRTYGKRSRQELDDAELLDFLRYLETQPAAMQTPF